MVHRTAVRSALLVCAYLGLAACGGGDGAEPVLGSGGSGGSSGGGLSVGGGNSDTGTYTAGVFPAASTYENKCVAPRSGANPATPGQNYPDTQGTAFDEKMFLRSWTNDLYLWYSEVADTNPGSYTTAAYFNLLKTTATTASGAAKDKFHFTYPSDQWYALSTQGVSASYGLTWVLISATPPRNIVIGYTEPSTSNSTSPAAAAHLTRGTTVLAVDGVDINAADSTSVDTLNAGLFPETVGESHQFTLQAVGGSPSTITLTSASVTSTPVQNVKTLSTGSSLLGYLLFNDHIATAEQELIAAVNTLSSQNINDLVLDIRYNGGGYLDIANELAYMVGGSGTAGKTFEQLQFNSKHTTTDPVTGAALAPTQFHTVTQGFSVTANQPLPTLNLARVFVLTGPDTCSASESIINGLRGADIEVIQIGSTTCGKPYGFYPEDNCGVTYFSIQFRGINAKGFGDYPDGFSPANTVATEGVTIPGCSVADDFTHELGDEHEARLAEALQYQLNGSCSVTPSGISGAQAQLTGKSGARLLSAVNGATQKAPFLQNRILRP